MMPFQGLMLTSRVITLGLYSVGKTSFIRRYADNDFESDHKATLGVEMGTKNNKNKLRSKL